MSAAVDSASAQPPAWLVAGRVVYDSARHQFGRVMAVGEPYDQRGYLGNGSDTTLVVPYPGGGIGWEAAEKDLTPARLEDVR
ncbi:hypothetical protein NGB36_28290 [Streptomyces sp. RB6PN25]|uniref:PRC-barrel domain containing protein n=1 Tax=Streptomyces humicola TaxID=2953240 RepID=A0ABT1Q374_9ACTN|nr:hypothetical protein [Streptomyces humicola]MCQ4084375.1 hypothetical protein [Streptomyces humicola]